VRETFVVTSKKAGNNQAQAHGTCPLFPSSQKEHKGGEQWCVYGRVAGLWLCFFG
jgi:hypothetical protein